MNPTVQQESLARTLVDRIGADSDSAQMFMVSMLVIFVTGIVVAGRTVRAVSRERTRREIAAYIAEGTMTPEQGDRLMKSSARDA